MHAEISWLSQAASMENFLHYMGDQNHPEHVDKIIGQAVQNRDSRWRIDVRYFFSDISQNVTSVNRQVRRGRKITRKIQNSIIRTPDGAWLTDEEATWYQKQIIRRMEWKAAVSQSHSDKFTGAIDFHFLSVYEKDRSNPISKLRAVSDEVHNELNLMRRESEMPRIETMPEARHRLKKVAGIRSLTEQLAAVPNLGLSNLQNNIESLGHTVTRYNEERGTISVIHQGKKKAHRYYSEDLVNGALKLRSLHAMSLPVIDFSTPDVDVI